MTFERVDIGEHTLYRGDCLDVLPTLDRVDAVVTDPPYGVRIGGVDVGGNWRKHSGHGLVKGKYMSHDDTYEAFVETIAPRINAYLDIATRAAVFSGPHIHDQRKPDAIGGVYCSAACGRHNWGFKNFLPLLLYGTYPGLQFGAKVPTAISSNESAEKNGHPCPKPLAWMQWAVRLASFSGDCVCDPFMGSGTTGVACVQTGRKFIGIELDEKYFRIAVRRIEEAMGKGSLFDYSSSKPVPDLFADAESANP